MKHLTDQELMKIVQAGDYSPASELYDRHSKWIYNFASRILRNPELAEDATQEVFLRMIRHAHTFKDNASLRTWLYAITSNWCRDYFRRADNQAVKEGDEVLATLQAPFAERPDQRIEQSSTARMVKAALDKLTHDQREAIVLARYHEMSHDEIAKVVGCSVGAVKTRIFRAMESLRNILNPVAPQSVATPVEESPVEETNV
ncbi:MAG TPA: RNA polymerase sigma factor [Thermoanaerobaculia bacterium]|jgi:RNA polymerase sigma-70 factor (ECF subfamily)